MQQERHPICSGKDGEWIEWSFVMESGRLACRLGWQHQTRHELGAQSGEPWKPWCACRALVMNARGPALTSIGSVLKQSAGLARTGDAIRSQTQPNECAALWAHSSTPRHLSSELQSCETACSESQAHIDTNKGKEGQRHVEGGYSYRKLSEGRRPTTR